MIIKKLLNIFTRKKKAVVYWGYTTNIQSANCIGWFIKDNAIHVITDYYPGHTVSEDFILDITFCT